MDFKFFSPIVLYNRTDYTGSTPDFDPRSELADGWVSPSPPSTQSDDDLQIIPTPPHLQIDFGRWFDLTPSSPMCEADAWVSSSPPSPSSTQSDDDLQIIPTPPHLQIDFGRWFDLTPSSPMCEADGWVSSSPPSPPSPQSDDDLQIIPTPPHLQIDFGRWFDLTPSSPQKDADGWVSSSPSSPSPLQSSPTPSPLWSDADGWVSTTPPLFQDEDDDDGSQIIHTELWNLEDSQHSYTSDFLDIPAFAALPRPVSPTPSPLWCNADGWESTTPPLFPDDDDDDDDDDDGSQIIHTLDTEFWSLEDSQHSYKSDFWDDILAFAALPRPVSPMPSPPRSDADGWVSITSPPPQNDADSLVNLTPSPHSPALECTANGGGGPSRKRARPGSPLPCDFSQGPPIKRRAVCSNGGAGETV
ncbi:uncharacterized protein LOC136713686 [Amia ocellicauda]|uniref:uncharacterized protein LOC136713686 n=1 Tax=Amia ocellicauda TaxID=2972642 RepID=UPI003464505D